MASLGSGGDIAFSNMNEEIDYSNRLYKAILNLFSQSVHAVELKDCESISMLLTTEQMQQVQRRYDIEGNNAAARQLLDHLRIQHSRWFPALMEAMNDPHLKLQDLKRKLLKEKERVDAEWKRRPQQGGAPRLHVTNPSGGHIGLPTPDSSGQLRSPTQVSSCPLSPDGVPPSDFTMSGLKVQNREGIQTDAVEEHEQLESPEGSNSQLAQASGTEAAAADPDETQRKKPADGARAQFFLESTRSEEYVEASSVNTYDGLQQARSEPSEYSALTKQTENMQVEQADQSMEVDAAPEQVQPMENPSAESMRSEMQGAPPSGRRYTTRAEHPSLRNAISGAPNKDFDGNFVSRELNSLPGWVGFKEETQVMDVLRSKIQENGCYVIWFWELAKRPTICVTYNQKLVTFVVHKSPRAFNPSYYINRRQKKSRSLSELVNYHIGNGIQYTSRENQQEMSVNLTTPAM